MDLAGGGVDAQAGAREDARILSSGQVEGDSRVEGYRFLDTRQHYPGHRRQEIVQNTGRISDPRSLMAPEGAYGITLYSIT